MYGQCCCWLAAVCVLSLIGSCLREWIAAKDRVSVDACAVRQVVLVLSRLAPYTNIQRHQNVTSSSSALPLVHAIEESRRYIRLKPWREVAREIGRRHAFVTFWPPAPSPVAEVITPPAGDGLDGMWCYEMVQDACVPRAKTGADAKTIALLQVLPSCANRILRHKCVPRTWLLWLTLLKQGPCEPLVCTCISLAASSLPTNGLTVLAQRFARIGRRVNKRYG